MRTIQIDHGSRERTDMNNRITYIEKLHEMALTDGVMPAIVYDSGTSIMSYETLDKISSSIADKIRRQGVAAGEAVTVMMKRNALSIAAEIGVMKAGAVFVPVVPTYYEERISYIRKDCGAKLNIEEDFFEDISEYDAGFECTAPKKDVVSIIYTSCTTGRPKGVVYDLAAYNEAVNRLGTIIDKLKGSLILGSFAPMAFVAHIFEFASVFCFGGTTHIIPDDVRTDPIKLEYYYRENRISVGFMSPKLFVLIKRRLPDFEIVLLGGDKICDIDPKDYNVLVCYSQTEALGILRYPLRKRQKEAFIGFPSPGTTVFLLDEYGNDVGIKKEGEICAKGIYPRRYLNLPEESGKTFEETGDGEVLVHTGDIGIRCENGVIKYVNRRDFMVKINGNRVDPSETERAMKTIPGVDDSAVKAFEDKNGKAYLCGFYVSGDVIEVKELKEYLKKELPSYMIPTRFVRMDSFPKNDNGKLDRVRLPEPVTLSASEYVVPVTEEEIKLCSAVEKILGIERAGMQDNFFDLGADSVHVAMLIAALEQEGLGVIEAKQIYENPVLAKLSECISDNNLVGGSDYTVLSKGQEGYAPLIFFHTANTGCESYRTLARALPAEIPIMGFENHNLNYPDFQIKGVKELVKFYRLIGSSYFDTKDRNGRNAVIYGGWSFGGTLAFEAALDAQKSGR